LNKLFVFKPTFRYLWINDFRADRRPDIRAVSLDAEGGITFRLLRLAVEHCLALDEDREVHSVRRRSDISIWMTNSPPPFRGFQPLRNHTAKKDGSIELKARGTPNEERDKKEGEDQQSS